MSYAELAKQRRADRVFKTPEGDYTTLLAGHEYFKTRKKSGNMGITLTLKPIESPTQEIQEKLTEKKRTIKKHLTFTEKNWDFGDFLTLLEDMGLDLSTVKEQKDDPDLKDLRQALTAAEQLGVRFKVRIEWEDDKAQFPNIKILEVSKVFNLTAEEEAANKAEILKNMPGTKAPAEETQATTEAAPETETTAAETTTAAVSGPSYDDMKAAGWTDEQMKANPDYAHLVPKADPPPPPPPANDTTPPPPPAAPETETTPATTQAAAGGPPANPFG